MKQINSIKIISVTMSGFRCFTEKTTYEFGDTTFITGHNGQGKSSIADAIAFAFTGTSFFGERLLDRLQNDNSREMMVSVDFADDNFTSHSLTRVRKNDITSISYDEYNIRQADLTTIFGEKELFLSILNPLYFINVLGDDGKSLLEKMLPMISHETVLGALSESSKEQLNDQSLLSPETYIKNRKLEIKELEEDIIYMQGQKDLLDQQQRDRTKILSELNQALELTQKDIAVLTELRNKDRNIKNDEELLTVLYRQKDELLSENPQKDADMALIEIMDKMEIASLVINKEEKKPYESEFKIKLDDLDLNLKYLYEEHRKIGEIIGNTVVGYKCPTCSNEITDQNVDSVMKDLQSKLSSLVSRGKKTKAMILELKQADSISIQKLEEYRNKKLTEPREALALLQKRKEDLIASREQNEKKHNENLASINDKINLVEHQKLFGNLSNEQVLKLTSLEETLKDIEMNIKFLEDSSQDKDLAQSIATAENDIVHLKRLVSEALLYAAKRAELTFAGLKMNRANISLFEIVKSTGEIKDCFKFTFDGKNYRCLSLSEKIRAGLEVSEMVKRLSDKNYPVFIDNGESICVIDNIRPTGQKIFSRVVKGENLTVTGKINELRKVS